MRLRLTKSTIDAIIVFALLFLSVSFVVSNNLISSTTTTALWLFVLVALILLGRICIISKLIIITFLLLALMLFTTLIRTEEIAIYAKNAYSICVACLFASTISFERFSVAYVKVIKILSTVSLVGYGVHLIIPSVFNMFVVQNAAGASYSNFVLYIQSTSSGQNAFRNWGFAWEPGAFATFVCLAMLLEVLVVSKKMDLKTVIIYGVTIFTTFSTTGIIAFLGLCVFLVVTNNIIGRRTKRAIISALITAILFIVIFSNTLFNLQSNSVFGKIINFINSDDYSNINSASVRYFSITKVFLAFLQSPIYGWGYRGLMEQTKEFTRGMNTCTFINWFAVYGAIFGGVMFYGMVRLAKALTYRKAYQFVVLIFIFGITMTENYVHCPMIYLLVMYGYTAIRKTACDHPI